MLLDKTNPAFGLAPLSPLKLSNTVIVSPSIGIENTVPFPSTPPLYVVPYNFVLSDDKINPATGLAPLVLVKLSNTVILLPVDMEKTVPKFAPPLYAVPYKMPLYKTSPACGLAPLVLVKLSNTLIVPAPPAIGIEKTVPYPYAPSADAVPYKMLLDKTNPACGLAPLVPAKLSNTVIVPVPPAIGIENTVPYPFVPPLYVVPYNFVLSDDKTNPACGLAPLVPVKLSNTLIVLPVAIGIENTVPYPFIPPLYAVPYKMPLYKTNPAFGLAPLASVKLSNVVSLLVLLFIE